MLRFQKKIALDDKNKSVSIKTRGSVYHYSDRKIRVIAWGAFYREKPSFYVRGRCLTLPDADCAGVVITPHDVLIFRSFPGIIPLFYKKTASAYYISDLASLIGRERIDDDELKTLIMYRTGADTHSFFRDALRLEAGSCISITSGENYRLRYSCRQYPDFREGLIRAVQKRIVTGSTGLLLSDGLDSGLLNTLIPASVPVFSVISDPICEKIIDGRVVGRRNLRFPMSYEINQGWPFPDSVFCPSASVFLPVFQQAQAMGLTHMMTGIGGDEIHGVDYMPEFVADSFLKKPFSAFFFRMIRLIMRRPGLLSGTGYRRSLLKYRIMSNLKSTQYSLILEMIYSLYISHGIFPLMPYLDRALLHLVLSMPVDDILRYSPDRQYARRLSSDMFCGRSRKKSFDDVVLTENGVEKNTDINYNRYLAHKFWSDEYERKKRSV